MIESMVNTHAHYAHKRFDSGRDEILRELVDNGVIAVIELAIDMQKPLVIHCREAYDEIINILREYKLMEGPGVIHCFSEKLEGYSLYLRANLCDEEGGILFVNKSYSGISFEMVNYDAFSITCLNLTRFFDIDKLHHIEIYPNVRKVSDEE